MTTLVRTFLVACVVTLGGCDGRSEAKPLVLAEDPASIPEAAVAPNALAAPPPAASGLTASSAPQLTRVEDVSQVCMVNDQFMGRAQIPVVVEGKTYFGCCEMCKGRLARDAAARVAKDPVSGNAVDKSAAVIAKREDGQVLYFESTRNLERFRTGPI